MIYCLRNENPLGALLIKFSKDDSSTANCAEFKKKNSTSSDRRNNNCVGGLGE